MRFERSAAISSGVWRDVHEVRPLEEFFPNPLNLLTGWRPYRDEVDLLEFEKGHVLSFEEFFAKESSAVYRAVYFYTGDRELSEDAAQEAFARAYSRWSSLERESWAAGWVFRTALNVAKRRLKREWLLQKRISSTRTVRHNSPPSGDRVLLVDALRQLPERQREAVVLFYLVDLPISDVALMMGITQGAVKAHLSQARPKLRHVLEVDDD